MIINYFREQRGNSPLFRRTMNINKKSKFLALILRHNPSKIGIVLDEHGWVDVADLCDKMPISKDILDEIVNTDLKQRYSYSEDGLKIRANQGHSIYVDVELEEKEPPEFLYHGTCTRFLESISKDGLKSMSRQYVHLSSDYKTAVNVGSRHGKPVVLMIKALQMHNSGLKFFLSKNEVWLTNDVPIEFFEIKGKE